MLIRPGQPMPQTAGELIPPALAARLDGLDVRTRRVFAGKMQGERRSKRRGRSVEFDDFRPYVPGDDLRHIDWNIAARLDRFFLKLFLEEEDLTVHLVLDASASMLAGEPSKVLGAARLAGALSYASLINNNRLVLSAFGLPPSGDTPAPHPQTGLLRLEPLRGRRSTQRAANFLLDVLRRRSQATPGEPGPSDFAAALRQVAQGRAGRGVVVVLSDLLIPPAPDGKGNGANTADPQPGYAAGLRYLSDSANFETFVFQVLAPGEIDPALEAPQGSTQRSAVWGDLRLLDAEDGGHREVTVTGQLIARYRGAAARYIAQAGEWCRARGMQHVLVRSDRAGEPSVVDALRRVGVLG